jgi:hypothetical protein
VVITGIVVTPQEIPAPARWWCAADGALCWTGTVATALWPVRPLVSPVEAALGASTPVWSATAVAGGAVSAVVGTWAGLVGSDVTGAGCAAAGPAVAGDGADALGVLGSLAGADAGGVELAAVESLAAAAGADPVCGVDVAAGPAP